MRRVGPASCWMSGQNRPSCSSSQSCRVNISQPITALKFSNLMWSKSSLYRKKKRKLWKYLNVLLQLFHVPVQIKFFLNLIGLVLGRTPEPDSQHWQNFGIRNKILDPQHCSAVRAWLYNAQATYSS